VKIVVDTNVIVRTLVQDNPEQASIAQARLGESKLIALPLTTLCETAWVLRKVYGFTSVAILSALEAILTIRNIELNRPAVEAGLAVLRAGGDFADGVIAHEGWALGGDVFVSFDRKAVKLLHTQGYLTQLL